MKALYQIVEELAQNPPAIFQACYFPKTNNKGDVVPKSGVLNLATGDIMCKKRGVKYQYANNYLYMFGRRYGWKGFQNAQVVDNSIIITNWVYTKDTNETAECTRLDKELSNRTSYFSEDIWREMKFGEVVCKEAAANIILPKPILLSAIRVRADKQIDRWDNDTWCLINGESIRLLSTVSNAADAKRVVGLLSAFQQVFEYGFGGSNQYVTFSHPREIPLFMKNSLPKLKKTPAAVVGVVEKSLPEHAIENADIGDAVCFIDRVDEQFAVVRWYKQAANRSVETMRMYVNKTNTYLFRLSEGYQWSYYSSNLKPTSFQAKEIVLASYDVCDGTKIAYSKNLYQNTNNPGKALYMLLNYPEFEKMYKLGLDYVCNQYLDNTWSSWDSFLTWHCGVENTKNPNVCAMLGVNSYQLKRINEFHAEHVKRYPMMARHSSHSSIIYTVKKMFNADETGISSVDNDTFDYILNSLLSYAGRMSSGYTRAVALAYRLYGKDAIHTIRDLNNVGVGNEQLQHELSLSATQFIVRHGMTHMTVDGCLLDILRMIDMGNYSDRLRPRFSSKDELAAQHEMICDLLNADSATLNQKREEKYISAFDKQSESWKKYEYDEHDKYCIVAPTAPIDLVVEGMTLHHCVRSYIPCVANGESIILFIRDKKEPGTPFFTVEIVDKNVIRQVHGQANSLMCTVDGLPEFIDRWAKAKRLHYTRSNANRICAPRNRY